jgi:tripartite ATP-independent transporter DctP family solute receptor
MLGWTVSFAKGTSVALLAFAASATTPGQAQEFKSSDVEMADHASVRAVTHMSELLRQRSNNRLSIDPGAGDKDSEIFTIAQVRAGSLDMARLSVSALGNTVPESAVLGLPFLFKSTEHRRRVLAGPIGDELLSAFSAHDLIGLCFFDAGARSLYTVTAPVRTAADMKGLRIRVQPVSAIIQTMKALNAVPVPMPYTQIMAALNAGTIDGAENNLASYLASKHYEKAKFYSATEHTAPPAILVFSKQRWSSLSPDDQKLIQQAAKESVQYRDKLLDDEDQATREKLAASGVQFVIDVDKASFSSALAPLYPELVSDPRIRALAERIKAE